MAQTIISLTASLAPAGSTGNNIHAGVNIGASIEAVAAQFVVEAAGATPTVTFKVQGTDDDPSIADASAVWNDIPYFPANSDTVATATQVVTAVGTTSFFLDIASGARFFRRFRLVTTANTNITYHANIIAKANG